MITHFFEEVEHGHPSWLARALQDKAVAGQMIWEYSEGCTELLLDSVTDLPLVLAIAFKSNESSSSPFNRYLLSMLPT